MPSPRKYVKQIEEILKAAAKEGEKRPEFQWRSATAAKKNLKIIKGLEDELRKLKQQIRDEIEKTRADFAQKKTAASRGTNLSGRGGFLMKKGTMSNMRLEDIRRQELTSLFPFESAARRVDEEITTLDKVKSEIDKWLESNLDSQNIAGDTVSMGDEKHE
jgi:hypothetical protein